MQGEIKERWMEICARIAEEQDRHELIELVDELNRVLEEEGKRLGILTQERSVMIAQSASNGSGW